MVVFVVNSSEFGSRKHQTQTETQRVISPPFVTSDRPPLNKVMLPNAEAEETPPKSHNAFKQSVNRGL